ncbi:Aste57867_17790 [Aphanomyces stellatus]|uniref:Aste57867_17790 protein n=1 Tax=Aphanomyces stellatus TaxID=120398 RepID=A0A485L9R0_9STRA|nr:hypothetical protein As57867_017729 [Aphanomyces stellatus]VFT94534.1 Aste57867_17790 [Aphanomyces stellatus]
MTQLADALAYLHAHGVVHRDVKAENVLLHSSSVHAPLLLADFGFAKRLPWTKGTTCGTPAYMAPEVLLGHAYDAAVDCWSLGVILYMLLSGQPPFPGSNHADICQRVVQAHVSMDHPNWATVGDDAKALVLALLTKDPATRLTAAQVQDHRWMHAEANDAVTRDRRLTDAPSVCSTCRPSELTDDEDDDDDNVDAALERELAAPIDI